MKVLAFYQFLFAIVTSYQKYGNLTEQTSCLTALEVNKGVGTVMFQLSLAASVHGITFFFCYQNYQVHTSNFFFDLHSPIILLSPCLPLIRTTCHLRIPGLSEIIFSSHVFHISADSFSPCKVIIFGDSDKLRNG